MTQPVGIAFALGLTVTVQDPTCRPNRIVMQPEIEEWLKEANITDWELRWAEAPKESSEYFHHAKSTTLETYLIFTNERDAVLFKMTFAGRLKAPSNKQSYPSIAIRSLGV